MGFLIEILDPGRTPQFLSCDSGNCIFGLDSLGGAALGFQASELSLQLFELSAAENNKAILKRLAPEIKIEVQGELGQVNFTNCIEVKWRGLQFQVLQISAASFALAKANHLPAKIRKSGLRLPRQSLLCRQLNLDMPLFDGVDITIGRHPLDTIQVLDPLIKPKHAEVVQSKLDGKFGIQSYLGKVDIKPEADVTYFSLLPSHFEFMIIERYS